MQTILPKTTATTYGTVSESKPALSRATHGENSEWLTAGIIIADVVGAGILSMAVAVSKMGWLLGGIAIVLLLLMNVHISMLMWRVRIHFPEVRTYTDLVQNAFSRAPAYQCDAMTSATAGLQYPYIFFMLGLYSLSLGKGLGILFYSTSVCLPTWTFVACGFVMVVVCTARRMGKWSSLIYLNVATIVGTCLIPLISMSAMGVEESRPDKSSFVLVENIGFENGLSALSICTFAFTSQFMLVEIMNEMKDVSKFPKAYVELAAPFQVVMFLLVGEVGYYFVGSAATGMIVDNIPFGFASQAAAFCLLAHMIVTYLIKAIVLCLSVHRLVDRSSADDDSVKAWLHWVAIVVATTFSAYVLSQLVPFFTQLVDFIGASFTPLCCYVIPILTYWRFRKDFAKDDDGSSFGLAETALIMFELIFSFGLCLFGTYFALQSIVADWSTYGVPFACHCENMWNTCECSAAHAGMKDMCMVELT